MQRLSRVLIFSAFFMLWAGIAVAQTYVQLGDKQIATSGIGAEQLQGCAVALSGDGSIAVVGASSDNTHRGAFYIFGRAGNTWIQKAKLTGSADFGTNRPLEGYSVAISADGSTVAVGGYNDNETNLNGVTDLYAGAVWIFVYNGTAWVEQAKLRGTNTQWFGEKVCLSADGSTAFIGSTNKYQYQINNEVWVRTGTNWARQATLIGATNNNNTGPFSIALSADGNTALMGVVNDDNTTNGAAWIFTRSGTDWSQQSNKLTAPGPYFGYSAGLSADGNIAFIGATGSDYVYAYARSGNVWTQVDMIRPVDQAAHPAAGFAISTSADGNVLLIGGPGASPSGAAWIFKRTPAGNWQQGDKLQGTDGIGNSQQGSAVALSADGKTALIGGPNDQSDIGAFWFFGQVATPTINVGPVSGTITTCEHSASVNPNIQQFAVTGTSLVNHIAVSASPGFDISLDPNDNYNTTLIIPQNPNLPGSASAIIYVRASSIANAGPISGNVALGSTGANAQSVAVSGTVYAIATADQKMVPAYTSGQTVPAINFTGSADAYNWTSDNPAIGLSLTSGSNSIPSFTATNNGTSNITAHIKVTPINNNGCNGADMLFDIVVKPVGPYVSVSAISGAPITTCQGVPSTDYQQFTVSADNLTGSNKIIIKPTNSSVQVSTIPSPLGFIDEIPLSPQTGTVTAVTIYIRISAAAPAGALLAAINITYTSPDGTFAFARTRTPSGTVRAQGSVNPVANPQNCTPNVRKKITFSGSATQFKWTNDNASIGLGFTGFGDIDFVPVNNGTTPITAHLTVIPVNSFGCEGTPFPFIIIVPATQANVIQVSGSLPLLSTNYGTPSVGGSFKVSGDNMQSAITVTPPLGYEVSTDDITFSKTLTVGVAGTISQTDIYIRLAKTTPAGTYPGYVIMSSTGTADAKIAVNPIDAVGKVPLIITADNKTKITGTANPVLTASYQGFVNNEGLSVFSTPPVLSTTATINSPPGIYLISASGAAAANYSIIANNGIMTVKPQPLNIVANNAFTPNGDGINDTWIIKNIDGFPGSVVQVFNRYGAPVFYSVGYARPWDGTSKGTELPMGTYYYVIDLKNGDKPVSGWVAIIR